MKGSMIVPDIQMHNPYEVVEGSTPAEAIERSRFRVGQHAKIVRFCVSSAGSSPTRWTVIPIYEVVGDKNRKEIESGPTP